MKTHEEIIARLALYRNHTVQIPASDGKMITEKFLAHWDELKTGIIGYNGFTVKTALTHEFKRNELPHDPKGESFVKHYEYNNYRLKQGDFELRLGYTSSYGFSSDVPMAVSFALDYYHGGEHQFGIYAPFSGSDNLIHELQLRSMDHSESELISLGNQLLEVLK